MGDVSGLHNKRVERLVARLRSDFEAQGSSMLFEDDLDVTVLEWRRAARAAAAAIGRPVRTYARRGIVNASLTDWPANPDEERKKELAMRRAVEAAALRTTRLTD